MTREDASKLASQVHVLVEGYYTHGLNIKVLNQPDRGRFMGLLPNTDWALVALPCAGWGIKTAPLELIHLPPAEDPLNSSDPAPCVRASTYASRPK